jgi:phosphoribosylformylglycinamidine (FGAM) synthase PurS component
MTVEVLVKLAGRDPWSFTVLDALVRKHGIASLAGVERLKSWRLDFDTDSKNEALELTSKILAGTALLANPNRDVWGVRGASRSGLPESLFGGQAAAGWVFAARVSDTDDLVGRSMAAVLKRRLGISTIAGVAFSLVWILRFDGSEDDAAALAGRAAVVKSWRQGLLSNPHSQRVHVFGLEDFMVEGAES